MTDRSVVGMFLRVIGWRRSMLQEKAPGPYPGSIAATAFAVLLMLAAPAARAQELGRPMYGQAFTAGQGQTLEYFGSPNEASCRAACQAKGTACQAYTWVAQDGYQPGDPPMCYLMSSYGTPSSHTCCVSAWRPRASAPAATEAGCCEWTMPDGRPNCGLLAAGAPCQGTFVPRSPGCDNNTVRCVRR